MTIQDESKTACCSALVAVAKNKAPCLSNTSRMVPDCNYKCVIKSTVEAKISFSVPGDEKQSSEETYNIKATGSYSEVEACVMYGQTSKGKTRSHWGLILQQENHWSMNNHAGRCILFHHLGNGVEIAVGCRGCVRKRVMRVYGNEIPRIRNSSALILDDQKLQSNDFWVTVHWDEMWHWDIIPNIEMVRHIMRGAARVVVDWQLICCFIWNWITRSHGRLLVKFTMNILNFYLRLNTNAEMKKVAALVDGQYKLSKAVGNYLNFKNFKWFTKLILCSFWGGICCFLAFCVYICSLCAGGFMNPLLCVSCFVLAVYMMPLVLRSVCFMFQLLCVCVLCDMWPVRQHQRADTQLAH